MTTPEGGVVCRVVTVGEVKVREPCAELVVSLGGGVR